MNINEKSWPEDRVVPPIEQSIDLSETYKTVEDRYYTRFFYQQEDGEDQVVLVHSNRICLVSISPNHPGVFSQFISRRYFYKSKYKMLQILALHNRSNNLEKSGPICTNVKTKNLVKINELFIYSSF